MLDFCLSCMTDCNEENPCLTQQVKYMHDEPCDHTCTYIVINVYVHVYSNFKDTQSGKDSLNTMYVVGLHRLF